MPTSALADCRRPSTRCAINAERHGWNRSALMSSSAGGNCRSTEVPAWPLILSLGVALGAAMAAFRLVDAVLLRPLPIAHPESVFAVATTFVDSDGHVDDQDEFDYPSFRRYASAIGDQADSARPRHCGACGFERRRGRRRARLVPVRLWQCVRNIWAARRHRTADHPSR